MKSSIYWKIAFSVLLLVWAMWNLWPLSDTPFDQYLVQRASAHTAELQTLIKHAQDLTAQAKQEETDQKAAAQAAAAANQVYLPDAAKTDFIQRHRTFYLSFKSICEDEGLTKDAKAPVDLWTEFFPSFNAGDTKNVKHRNELILTELLKESKGRIKYGLDLQGGLGFTLKLDDASLKDATSTVRAQSLDKAIEIINKRINAMGVSETVTRVIGDDSVEILMPGASSKDNPDAADVIKKPAKLEFRIAEAPPGGVAPPAAQIPLGYELMMEEDDNPDTGDLMETPYIVSTTPVATGNIISTAYPITDPTTGQFKVAVNFTSDGAKLMGALTAKLVNTPQLLAIVLDGKLNSAPRVNDAFSSSCVVEGGGGGFTQKEAFDLANVLNNPLDKALTLEQMTEVGPSLAQDARTSSLWAGLVGTALVVVFMCGIYSFAGFLSVVTLILNVVMILGVQASIGATLTLPGVAALVLTIGMAVDANILIYERMREEMSHGKNLFNSLEAGHDRALAAILDSHVTSIITAVILMWLGTGPIKGFGVILAIGLVANLFCVLVFNYALLEFGDRQRLADHREFEFPPPDPRGQPAVLQLPQNRPELLGHCHSHRPRRGGLSRLPRAGHGLPRRR